MKFFIEAG